MRTTSQRPDRLEGSATPIDRTLSRHEVRPEPNTLKALPVSTPILAPPGTHRSLDHSAGVLNQADVGHDAWWHDGNTGSVDNYCGARNPVEQGRNEVGTGNVPADVGKEGYKGKAERSIAAQLFFHQVRTGLHGCSSTLLEVDK